MAIYDKTADAATAVAAWLTQFKVAANGTITYVSGSDTFHTWWLHRSLQKIAWDFAISGDDEINLSKPSPSTSEALGTIITLNDWTTDYGVSYKINDTVASYHFGGSVEQEGGATGYYGLKVLGSLAGTTSLQIVQNGALLTSHWGTGKNQTDASTLIRVLVKARASDADIDGKRVIVKASEWGDSYAIWETTLGLGESVAAINTSSDPQNDTLQATVEAYSITPSYGYKLLDVDGAGNKPFLGEWSYGAYSKKGLYEFVKSLLVRGTTQSFYGIDGDLWTGRIVKCVIGSGSGTWVQSETLSWTGGTGNLLGVDSTTGSSTSVLYLHLSTGVAPTDTQTITGNSSATGVVSGTPTTISTSANHLGQFTGSAWIGAFGIGFAVGELGSADSVTSLDGTILTPPNNVTATVNVTTGDTGDDPHVFLAVKHATNNAPDYQQYTVGSGNTSGNGAFVITESIASDTPTNGSVLVLDTTGGGTTYEQLQYTSWSGSTFTLSGTLPRTYTSGDPVFIPILYESAVGAGLTKTATSTMIYSTNRNLIGWVRRGSPSGPGKPVAISGTLTSAGISLSVVIDNESA